MGKFIQDGSIFSKLGGQTNGYIEPGITSNTTTVGTVMRVLADNAGRSLGDILVNIVTGEGKVERVLAEPIGRHTFTCPLPNEKVSCLQDPSTGNWYYTGILSNKYNINHMLNGGILTQQVTKKGSANKFFTGAAFKVHPDSARAIDIFEGDNIMQSRNGASLRMSHSNPNLNNPWKENVSKETKPIIILRAGHLPVENMFYDYTSLYLTSDQQMVLPFPTEVPDGVEMETFGKAQLVGVSDRIVLISRSDDILFSSGDKIHLLTRSWNHDVDVVLTELQKMIEQVKKLAAEVETIAKTSASEIYPIAGTPLTTLPSTQAGTYVSSVSKVVSIKQALNTIENNIGSLEQK